MRLTAWVLELRLVLQQTKAPATGYFRIASAKVQTMLYTENDAIMAQK